MLRPVRLLSIWLLAAFMATSFTAPASAQLSKELDFIKAVKKGKHHDIQVALLNGINYNMRDIDGTPVMMLAIERGDSETVGLLLDAGADPNIEDRKTGEVPITLAAGRNATDIVGQLLGKGANPNLADKQYVTPLIKAVTNNNRRMVKMLIEAGADPTWQDFTGHDARWYAKTSRRPGIEALLQKAPKGAKGD